MTEYNQQPNEGQVQQPQQQQPVQLPVQQQVQPQAPLPAEARDRTKEQFEKLLDNNRRLHEENEQMRRRIEERENVSQTFQSIQQVPPVAQDPNRNQRLNPEDFVDVDQNGQRFIDEQKLRNKIEEINQRASQASQAIESYIQTAERREIDRQNKEAFQAHPELNPESEKFDQEFNKQVRGILLDSMYNLQEYGGRPLSFREAADYIKTKATPAEIKQDQQQKIQVEQKKDQGATLKEQTSAEVTTQVPPQQRDQMMDSDEYRRVVDATRHGSTEALIARLMNTDHVRKEDA